MALQLAKDTHDVNLMIILIEHTVVQLLVAGVSKGFWNDTRNSLFTSKVIILLNFLSSLEHPWASVNSVFFKPVISALWNKYRNDDVNISFLAVAVELAMNLSGAHFVVINLLLKVRIFLAQQVERHPLSKADFEAKLKCVDDAIVVLFDGDTFNNPDFIVGCILNQDDDKNYTAMQKASCFAEGTMLADAIGNEVKCFLDRPTVALLVNTVLWASWQKDNIGFGYSVGFLRSMPVFLFILEAIGKFTEVSLIYYVAVDQYLFNHANRFVSIEAPDSFSTREIVLAVFFVSHLLYEVGQAFDSTRSMGNMKNSVLSYFKQDGNVFDTLTSMTGVTWVVLRCFPSQFAAARVLLSVVAIPESIGLLRYLSLHHSLGILVLMMKSMMSAVFSFAVVYIIVSFGFGIAFRALFGNSSGGDSGTTDGEFDFNTRSAAYLFSSTLANYNGFEIFATDSSSVNSLGSILTVLHLVVTAICFVNLLIAQMTTSYEKIESEQFREFQFINANLTRQFLLWEEHHPFCMLPAPLNVIPIMCSPIHWFLLWKHRESKMVISFAGSVVNLVIQLAVIPITCIIFVIVDDSMLHKLRIISIALKCMFCVIFPFLYPIGILFILFNVFEYIEYMDPQTMLLLRANTSKEQALKNKEKVNINCIMFGILD